MKLPPRPVLAALALLTLCAAAGADPLGVGDRVSPFQLDDPHDAVHEIDDSVRAIVFSRDMDGGDFIKQAMKGRDGEFLSERGLVYIADISGMPALVTRLFALPSMRRRGYPLLLDRDGSLTADLPDAAGQATRIRLDSLRVTRVAHFDASETLAAALSGLPVD